MRANRYFRDGGRRLSHRPAAVREPMAKGLLARVFREARRDAEAAYTAARFAPEPSAYTGKFNASVA